MKIIKHGYIETWFSPRRLMEENILSGNKYWYYHYSPERKVGPSAIFKNSLSRWMENGSIHRSNGASEIYASNKLHWYFYGIKTNEEEYWNS